MALTLLGGGTGQLPAITINIRPSEIGHLAAALPSHKQDFQRMAEGIAEPIECRPQNTDFILSLRALAFRLIRLLQADGR